MSRNQQDNKTINLTNNNNNYYAARLYNKGKKGYRTLKIRKLAY